MKKLIWWTAAVLLAVLAFWSTMQAVVFAGRWTDGGFPPKEDILYGQAESKENKQNNETEEKTERNEKGEEEEEEKPEEKPEAGLSGSVGHCRKWEEHRKEANRFWQENGCSEQYRSPEVFWAGEKFLLRAEAEGEKLPPYIRVLIEGTSYSTKLFPSEEGYSGELFDTEMLFQWGNQMPESLEFTFSAEIDGVTLTDRQQITVDNRQPYWLLHRKE